MSDCPDCTAARTNRNWAGYHAHCKGCQARMIAASPAFWQARRDGYLPANYQRMLADAGVSHSEVKAWATT